MFPPFPTQIPTPSNRPLTSPIALFTPILPVYTLSNISILKNTARIIKLMMF